ncbi:MAG TPA: sulfatase [Bryobacteraceae bacterium]|nr:sulfatase [Bryobacteraceae bacterium]
MRRRSFLAAAAAQAGTAGVFCASAAPPAPRLNVLFITADDLGLNLGCYGERRFSTPNLDSLAATGVRFTTAYVAQASCSPSRSAMFTGLFPHANGQYGLANTGFRLHEEFTNRTIPVFARKAGYRTGIIGKLHVEPESSFPWDHRKTGNTTRQVRTVAEESSQFIRESGEQPFFLMVNFSDPHAFRNEKAIGGWDFPPQIDGVPEKPLPPGASTLFHWQRIEQEQQQVRTAGYFNAIQRLDVGIGQLMRVLEESGKAANTLVIFVGDHGPPFARGKTTVYESGLRVPFFLRWPGVTKPGQVNERFVSTVDILPTILDVMGTQAPKGLHGDSLRKAVRGEKWREYLAAEFHCHGARPIFPRRAIRDTRYKLIHNLLAGREKPSTGIDGDQAYPYSREAKYDGTPVRQAFETFANPPEFELYDLQRDSIEFHNLAGGKEIAQVEERLKKALHRWRTETSDPFLDPSFLEKFLRDGAPATRGKKG